MIKQYYYKSTVKDEFNCIEDETESIVSTLKDEGYSIYSVTQKTNQLVPYHEHPSEEVVIVLEGRIRYVIEEEVVDLKKGDIIRVAAHSVHSMIGLDESGHSSLLLMFV